MSQSNHPKEGKRVVTLVDCEKLVELVKGYCSNQNFTDDTPGAWLTQFQDARMSMADCKVGIHAFAKTEAFANRRWRTIDHADIISAWRTVRRNTARRMAGGNVLPAPPDPDDPRAALEHQRAVYEALASGQQVPAELYSRERIAAQNRRVRALRAETSGEEGSGLPRSEATRTLVEEARRACAERTLPDPPKPVPRPTSRTPRRSTVHTDPLADTTTLGGALSGVFGNRVPTPDTTTDHSSWCGRCNHETGETIKVIDDTQIRVPCCAPERTLV